MTCKITWYFSDIASEVDDGWTESYYVSGNSTQPQLNLLLSGGALFIARRNILSQDFKISRVRVVDVDNRNNAQQLGYSLASGRGTAPNPVGATSNSAAPWTSVLLRLHASTLSRRNFPIHGIPQGVVTDASNLTMANAAWATLFAVYRGFVSGPSGYGMQLRKIADPGGAGLDLPTGVVIGGGFKGLTLTYPPGTAPATVARGDRVRLSGIDGANNCNGDWRVLNNTGDAIVLKPKKTRIFGAPGIPARFVKLVVTYNPVDLTVPIRGMSRKVGRPANSLRGRARQRTA